MVLPSGAQVAGLAGTSGRTEALPGPPTPSWAALPSAATKVSKVCISYAEFTRSVFPKVSAAALRFWESAAFATMT